MRNLKAIVILSFLVAMLGAANLLLFFGRTAERTAQRFALTEFRSDIVRVRLERKGAPATELVRQDGDWRLVAPFAGNADDRVVMKLVDAVSQTPVVDVISDVDLLRLGRTRADFSLEEPVLSARLTAEDGESCRLSFGGATPSDGGIYASVDGIGAVFVVKASVLAALDVSSDGFRLRSLSSLDAGSVSSFGIKREGSLLLEFTRNGEGWSIGNRRAAAAKVSKFIADLTTAQATGFFWPVGASNETDHVSASLLAGYGLDPESAVTVVLNDVNGSACRISFGKEVGAGGVYALVQNGGAIVSVPVGLKDFAAQSQSLFTDSRLFPVEARSVAGFSVVADGARYSLSRAKDGGWTLESPIVAAADPKTVDAILSRLLDLTSEDVAAEGGVAVSVSTNAPKISVARERLLGKFNFEDLRSREMLRLDPALVRRIVSTPDDGAPASSVVFDRERRTWNVDSGSGDASVDAGGVEAVLAAVNPLVAQRVVKLNVSAADLKDYGLDAPSLTIALDQHADDSVRRNILIGKVARGGRFATIGSSEAVFVISDSVFRKLATPIVRK